MKVIITGSTGMVGRSTLNECLVNDKISQVLIINRRELGISHPKLTELIHKDFSDFSKITDELSGFDACFHCMGVTSIGKNEEEFTKFTFDITKSLADSCFTANPNMVFNYVSGTGTDSSEEGKTMWARVKGKQKTMSSTKDLKMLICLDLEPLSQKGK